MLISVFQRYSWKDQKIVWTLIGQQGWTADLAGKKTFTVDGRFQGREIPDLLGPLTFNRTHPRSSSQNPRSATDTDVGGVVSQTENPLHPHQHAVAYARRQRNDGFGNSLRAERWHERGRLSAARGHQRRGALEFSRRGHPLLAVAG